ncbi:hypothetical protein [Klebsiella pneumoniae]|uniref:hypothetical protein n=1 Tax=Klebsiella pneumoniae TaxID=573 RepID=UPI001D0DD7BB|nr:hypothetical protein [Klebsiella pneumoniae]
MYHLDNTSGVPEMPEPKDEQSISPRWFGESQEQGGISWPGADWFNTVQAELLNLLQAAGIPPEKKSFNQLSKAIPVLGDAKLREELKDESGFQYVGQVSDFNSLRQIRPTQAGQRILLAANSTGYAPEKATGGGEFIAVSGSFTDDSGHVARVSDSMAWIRVPPGKVLLSDFGITPQVYDSGDFTKWPDFSDQLQAAIDRAKLLNLPLDTGFSSFNGVFGLEFIYVTKTIDISGLKDLRGQLRIHIHSDTFSPTWSSFDGFGAVIKNMNGQYDEQGRLFYGTTAGGQNLDTIFVKAYGTPPGNLQGMIHNTSSSTIRMLWAHGFNNTGVRLATFYDNDVGYISATKCGNKNNYACDSRGYPFADRADESNANRIGSILLHNNYYRDGFFVGTKNRFDKVHVEATEILSDYTTIPQQAYDEDVDTGFASFVFHSEGGSMGSLSLQGLNGNPIRPTAVIDCGGNSNESIYSSKYHLVISDRYYLQRGGAINNAYIDGNIKITGNAIFHGNLLQCTGNFNGSTPGYIIDKLICKSDVQMNAGEIRSGSCAGAFAQNQYGRLCNFSIAGYASVVNSSRYESVSFKGGANVTASPSMLNCTFIIAPVISGGSGTFYKCTFPAGFEFNNPIESMFNQCLFNGLTTLIKANARAYLRDCTTFDIDATGATNVAVMIDGGAIGTLKMNGYSGELLLCNGVRCKSGSSISGWAIPTTTKFTSGTMTINPYTGAGWANRNSVWTAVQL